MVSWIRFLASIQNISILSRARKCRLGVGTASTASLAAMLAFTAFPQQAYACGAIPQMPECNVPRCVEDRWIPWPVAAATPCNSGLGYCDGGIVVPGLSEPDAIGYCIGAVDINPRFHLQSIIYMPPGKQSSVSYGRGSSEGSRVATQTTSSTSFGVQVTVFGIGPSDSYAEGIINGRSMSQTKTDLFTITRSVNSGLDAPVRGSDQFDIWFNSKFSHYLSPSNGFELLRWSTVDGAPPQVYTFSADELLGNIPVSPSDQGRYNAFTTLTPQDKQAILYMDAPLNGAPLDSRRYQLVSRQYAPWERSMHGPDYPGNVITSFTYSMSYNQQWDTINGSFVNQSDSVLAGINLEVVRLGTTTTWTYNYMETRTMTSGEQQTASLTLRTPTVGCYMEVDIYIDAVFGTYLALPTFSSGCD